MAKHLVLVGAGAAHIEFMCRWAKRAAPGVQITLISRQRRFFDPLQLPFWLEALTEPAQTAIDIEAVAHRAKAAWPDAQAVAIDAAGRTVQLGDGQTLRYDWLSVDQEPAPSRTLTDIHIPGARKNGLFAAPLEPFLALWPQVLAMAQSRPISLAVVADAEGGYTALPLCLAIRRRLPGAAITLVTGGPPLANGQPPALRERLAQLLRQRNITVLADAAIGLEPGDLHLQSGARLACEVPLLCTRPHAPEWLTASGVVQGSIVGEGVAESASGGAGPAELPARSPSDHASALMAAVSGRGVAKPGARSRQAFTLLPLGGGQALMAVGQGAWLWQGYAPGWLARRRAMALWRRCQGLG